MFWQKQKKEEQPLVVKAQTEGGEVKLTIEIAPGFYDLPIDPNSPHQTEVKANLRAHLEHHLEEDLMDAICHLIAGIAASHPVLSCYLFGELERQLGALAGFALDLGQALDQCGGDSKSAFEVIAAVEARWSEMTAGFKESQQAHADDFLRWLFENGNVAESA